MSNKWFVLTVVAMSACTVFAASFESEQVEPLFSFEETNSTEIWRSVNDGVMGGRSKGSFERTEQKTLLFTGDLSLENGGGFASIRTTPGALNLGGTSGILVKARGDARTYRVQLLTDERIATSYRANLPTQKGVFNEVLIPFSDFKLQTFGSLVPNSEPIDPAAIKSIGLSVADKKAGPFEFELESIQIFRGEVKRLVKAISNESKPIIQEASYIDNALTIIFYHPPLAAKLARMVEMDGPARMLNSSPSRSPIIMFNDPGPAQSMTDAVYIKQGPSITIYDAKGREQRSFELPSEVPSEVRDYINFTVLPGGRIAFFDSRNDAIYFVGGDGKHLKTVAITDKPDRHIQFMCGIVVEDKLIVSHNGKNDLLRVDLQTYDVSVFRSLPYIPFERDWLGAITYSDGVYYVCQGLEIYSFTSETDEIKKFATTPKGHLSRAVVLDESLLVEANGYWTRPALEGAVYKIDLKSGKVSEVKNALNIPEGLMLLK